MFNKRSQLNIDHIFFPGFMNCGHPNISITAKCHIISFSFVLIPPIFLIYAVAAVIRPILKCKFSNDLQNVFIAK